MSKPEIAGYTYGTDEVARSPLNEEQFDQLKQAVTFSDEDVKSLQMAGEILSDQVEEILDVWYGFVGSHPHLAYFFSGSDGQPNEEYLAAVRPRFGQWIRDTCAAKYNRDWLNYQQEIGLRHTRHKKNRTDGVDSAAEYIPLRYLIAFIAPMTATIRPFLEKKGHSPEDVDKMYHAWFKAVVLQVSLWSQAYVAE